MGFPPVDIGTSSGSKLLSYQPYFDHETIWRHFQGRRSRRYLPRLRFSFDKKTLSDDLCLGRTSKTRPSKWGWPWNRLYDFSRTLLSTVYLDECRSSKDIQALKIKGCGRSKWMCLPVSQGTKVRKTWNHIDNLFTTGSFLNPPSKVGKLRKYFGLLIVTHSVDIEDDGWS